MNLDAPLSSRVVEDVVVNPTIRIASRPGRLLMGVVDAHGDEVEGTLLNRRAGEQGALVPAGVFAPASGEVVPEGIYAGPLYFHFGHFLLESLARTWYAARHPDVPLVWAGQHTWQRMPLRSWQREILDILGLQNPLRVVTDPTRFARLHVPDLGYRYDDLFHPEHAAFLARHEGPAQVLGERLWLSRSRIDTEVRDLNGRAVERRLQAAGWTVAHPERLGLRAQLDALAKAEVVAGEEGSAFHAVVLLADVAGKQLQVLRRHGPEHRNMHTVGDARHLRQTFHDLDAARVLEAKGRVVTKISPSSAEVLDILGVGVPDVRPQAADWADAVVGRVLVDLAPVRLLDVGASSAVPVASSTAPVRVAVSDRLRQDPRALTTAGVDVFELSLEQYAEHFHTDGEPFDVIRVSGRDVEEVAESFRVSRALAHDGTVWVLGCGAAAARAAVAVRTLHPDHAVQRLLVGRKVVFVARRAPGEPGLPADVAALPDAEVRRRTRWLRPTSLRRLRERLTADGATGEQSYAGAPEPGAKS